MSGAEILAIIPARGGSKGIPRKNIRPFSGYPLIAYSIAAARQAQAAIRVIVSTDDQEIAEVARHLGQRPPSCARLNWLPTARPTCRFSSMPWAGWPSTRIIIQG